MHVDGLILTKLDGTAKGGVVCAIKQELGIPVLTEEEFLTMLGSRPDTDQL